MEIFERMRARDDLSQIQNSHLTRPATDERRDHKNNKRTSDKHMETVRGENLTTRQTLPNCGELSRQ